MSNLPADWGSYYQICKRCDREYHMSGCTVCACAPCNVDDCDNIVNTDETYTCKECEDAAQGSECEECGGMGHTIGFEGPKKIKYPCESCKGGE